MSNWLYNVAREITDEVLGEGVYDDIHLNNRDPHVQAAIQSGRLNMAQHTPMAVHVPKMDTPTGLYSGACSCGWRGMGLGSEKQAMNDAKQHAHAKNTRVKTEADRQRERAKAEREAIESITRTVQERSHASDVQPHVLRDKRPGSLSHQGDETLMGKRDERRPPTVQRKVEPRHFPEIDEYEVEYVETLQRQVKILRAAVIGAGVPAGLVDKMIEDA